MQQIVFMENFQLARYNGIQTRNKDFLIFFTRIMHRYGFIFYTDVHERALKLASHIRGRLAYV